jgi:hypothetical protein
VQRLKQACDIRELLKKVEIEPSSSPNDFEKIEKAITVGFFTTQQSYKRMDPIRQ